MDSKFKKGDRVRFKGNYEETFICHDDSYMGCVLYYLCDYKGTECVFLNGMAMPYPVADLDKVEDDKCIIDLSKAKSALNADDVKVGDYGAFGDTIADLTELKYLGYIDEVASRTYSNRFVKIHPNVCYRSYWKYFLPLPEPEKEIKCPVCGENMVKGYNLSDISAMAAMENNGYPIELQYTSNFTTYACKNCGRYVFVGNQWGNKNEN